MKVSELQNEEIKEFCGIDDDCTMLEAHKAAAKAFIIGYTGLTAEEIDTHEDITFAYLALINDMSQNRDYIASRETLNPTASTILSLYSRNHLTGVDV